MAKKRKSTRRASSVDVTSKREMLKFEAESRVRDAIMQTPIAKKEVRRVMTEIQEQKARTRQRLLGKPRKKGGS